MKRITVLILVLLLTVAFASCVDYSGLEQAMNATPEATPTPSAEPMVLASAYDTLLNENQELNDYVEALLAEKVTADQDKIDVTEENDALTDALSAAELAVYRSVVTSGGMQSYFGVVTGATLQDDGSIVLAVEMVEPENEKFDASLYTKTQINDLNDGLTFASADMVKQQVVVDADTVVRYDHTTYPGLDSGFHAYVVSEIASAAALVEANEDPLVTLLNGPVYVFLTVEGTAVMVLEK